MSPRINQLARAAGDSATMSASVVESSHVDQINLAAGEPMGPPPDEVADAAMHVARTGGARYGPVAGIDALREGLAAQYARRTGVVADGDNVLVTAGGKPAIVDALRCVVDPGDEVLILAPAWPSFADQVRWVGGRAVVVPPGDELRPDPDAIARAVTDRTRAIILNSPVNPTGFVLEAARIRTIGQIALERDLWLISDEVYREMVFDEPAPHPVGLDPELAARTIVVESFSKRFAMTGYRLGAAIGPPPIIAAMARLQAASTTHPCVVSQHAGLAALGLEGSWEQAQLDEYRARRALVCEYLASMDGMRPLPAGAAFYVFIDVRGALERLDLVDDVALTATLRDATGVRVVPGSAFGAPGHVRLSYGVERERLVTALERLARWAADASAS